MTVPEIITAIRTALAPYVFRVRTEAQLQDQVTLALATAYPGWRISCEVASKAGRYDLLVRVPWPEVNHANWCLGLREDTGACDCGEGAEEDRDRGIRIVLELKLHSAPAPVERQAQRYAKMEDVDAVCVVTTSRRLAFGLGGMATLGGKPFAVVAVRTT